MKTISLLSLNFLFFNILISSQTYLPLEVGNKWQYLFTDENQFPIYSLAERSVTKDTIINNDTYYFFSGIYANDWLKYDDPLLTTWWADSERVFMDFSKYSGDSLIHFNAYSHSYHTIEIDSGVINIFNNDRSYKGWDWEYEFWPSYTDTYELFIDSIGVWKYHIYGVAPPFPWGATEDYQLLMAILIDSLGNPIYLTSHNKPQIVITPITEIHSVFFTINFQVNHVYNRYSWVSGASLNFISLVSMESFYSKADSVIPRSPIYTSGVNFPNYNVSTTVDTILLKEGFIFNYRILAKDRGIIQEISYSPDSGYFQCIWDDLSSLEEEADQLITYHLSQNYPNPFNPITILQYTIGSTQFVTLKVYDMLGREVATPVNEEKPAGENKVVFDGRNLPSGIYYYQLKAGNYTETKKMVLMK